jgi:hypothetical protein
MAVRNPPKIEKAQTPPDRDRTFDHGSETLSAGQIENLAILGRSGVSQISDRVITGGERQLDYDLFRSAR